MQMYMYTHTHTHTHVSMLCVSVCMCVCIVLDGGKGTNIRFETVRVYIRIYAYTCIQVSNWMSVPFPMNIILAPVSILEAYLQWVVTWMD